MRHLLRLATALTTSIAFLVPGAVLAQSTADWSGPYVGIGVTGLGSDSTLATDVSPTLPDSYGLSSSAFGGTLAAGFNLQYNQFVVGIEADGSVVSLAERLSGGNGTNSYDIDAQLNSLLTLRTRLGFATGPFLLYGTAGLAAGQASFEADLVENPSGSSPSSGDGVLVGTVVGAGVEYAVNDNLSLKAEGLVYSLGSVSGSGDYGKGIGGGDYTASYKPQGVAIKGGLNYRF